VTVPVAAVGETVAVSVMLVPVVVAVAEVARVVVVVVPSQKPPQPDRSAKAVSVDKRSVSLNCVILSLIACPLS